MRATRGFQSLAMLLTLATASVAGAQTLGPFRWQFSPFCNVVTLTVEQQGPVFALAGFDDQCGAAARAPHPAGLTGRAGPEA